MPEPGTPTDWTDAYRELLETVWLATEPDDDTNPTPEQTQQETTAQLALLGFAAEIRAGLAAGLLAPNIGHLDHDHAIAEKDDQCLVCAQPGVVYFGPGVVYDDVRASAVVECTCDQSGFQAPELHRDYCPINPTGVEPRRTDPPAPVFHALNPVARSAERHGPQA